MVAIDASAGLPWCGLSRRLCKIRRWGTPLTRHLTLRRHCSRPLSPRAHQAGFLNQPSPATAANRSSARTPQNSTIGRRPSGRQLKLRPVRRAPHPTTTPAPTASWSPNVSSSIATPLRRSGAAKSKYPPLLCLPYAGRRTAFLGRLAFVLPRWRSDRALSEGRGKPTPT